MKAEYVARHLATVDYDYIHYRQNLQELKYEQPQLQSRNSRKVTTSSTSLGKM
jgi:hypothetical protein